MPAIASCPFSPRVILSLLLVSSFRVAFASDTAPAPSDSSVLQTQAERTFYAETTSGPEVEQLLQELDVRSEDFRVEEFGRTVEGRRLLAAVVGKPLQLESNSAANDPRIRILIVANIHSGECSGKEAMLQWLRELALSTDKAWMDEAVLMIAPNYNADGDARRGDHRPEQAGPKLVGRRENAQNLDLNRDFTKLEAPETRALVQWINVVQPDVFMDLHTTDGSLHGYAITYDVPHHPAAPQPQQRYLSDELLPAVTSAMRTSGRETFYYGNFENDHKDWKSFGYGPRYSTEYAGLRGMLAILCEDYSHMPFKDRVSASKQFVLECVKQLRQDRPKILELTRSSKPFATAGEEIAVTAEVYPQTATVKVLGFENDNPQAAPKHYEVHYWGNYKATLSVKAPTSFVIPKSYAHVVGRLLMHGVQVHCVKEEACLPVSGYTIEAVEKDPVLFQSHHLTSFTVREWSGNRDIHVGDYLIEFDQPLGVLATIWLEPRSRDSLASWNFFEPDAAPGAEYPVWRLDQPRTLKRERLTTAPASTPLTLENLFDPDRSAGWDTLTMEPPRWLEHKSAYLIKQDDAWLEVDAASGAAAVLAANTRLESAFLQLAEFNEADAKAAASQVLAEPDKSKQVLTWKQDLYYVDVNGNVVRRLTYQPGEETMAELSPDGRLVAFIRKHNLCVANVNAGVEWAITTHGNEETLCGELDWVYQEELYGRGNYRGFWWSPDSRKLAFLELDERDVPTYTINDDIPVHQQKETIRYPKSGDPLPKVRLGAVSVAGGDVAWIDNPSESLQERLIVRVGWNPESTKVVYEVQDRPQTWLELRVADLQGNVVTLQTESSPAWVEAIDLPRWLKDGSFLWLSDRSGSRHVYKISADGQLCQPVTSGPWDVQRIVDFDEDASTVFLEGTRDSSIEVHGYQANWETGKCQRITALGASHFLQMDHAKRYFLDMYSSLEQTAQTDVLSRDGERLHKAEVRINDRLQYAELGKVQTLEIPLDVYTRLNAQLILPPGAGPGERHPVLIYTYAGPQASVVWNRWGGRNYLWHQYLASQGVAVLTFDPRSASSQGIRHTWPIHGRFGEEELKDLKEVLAWIGKQDWADAERVGLWGWSYGGYFTAYAMTHGAGLRCGISGAPVTHWANYDAIYTERYMKLPQTNEAGYVNSSVTPSAQDLQGKLLLIHGAIDENVHPANTLQLAENLQQAGKTFEMMIYPRNRHGIANPRQAFHLKQLMTNFLLRELGDAPASAR